MLLFNAFLMWCDPKKVLTASERQDALVMCQDATFTQADLAFAEKKAIACYRQLKTPSIIQAYKNFLQCCKHHLMDASEKLFFPVIYHLLLDEKSGLDSQHACIKLTELFSFMLREQTDALQLAPMGRCFIDNPHAFAAFLRYLLWNGVKPAQILSSHLLHDFFGYHLGSLEDETSEIKTLYSLLARFPETTSLCLLASKVRSKENELSSYALNGATHQEGLVRMEAIDTPCWFTPNARHFKNLYALFDSVFLKGVLFQWNQQKKEASVAYLKALFNQDDVIAHGLPQVLTWFRENTNVHLQQAMAELLTEDTFKRLVDNRVVSVLYLIPFFPQLITIIQAQDIQIYIRDLHVHEPSALALTSSLFVLFEGMRQHNSPHLISVFEALLDAALIDRSALDDELIVRKLRKFAYSNHIVAQKIHALEEELLVVVATHASSTIDVMNYGLVEDAWLEIINKIRALKLICDMETTCPNNKHELHVMLAKSLLKQCDISVPLFAAQIGIDTCFDEENITAYERLLVELLLAIDNEAILTFCVSTLDANAQRAWRTLDYGDASFYKRAAIEGNLSVIRWLEHSQVKPHESLDSLSISAARAGQWHVVEYFNTHDALKKVTINVLLHIAVLQGASNAIASLWHEGNQWPDQPNIEKEFVIACERADVESIRCFLSSPIKPSDHAIVKMFNQSMKRQEYLVAHVIAHTPCRVCLKTTVADVFIDAARHNQCASIDALEHYEERYFSPRLIRDALLQAVQACRYEAVVRITNFSICPLKRQDLEGAYEESVKILVKKNSFFARNPQHVITHHLSVLLGYKKDHITQTHETLAMNEQFLPNEIQQLKKPGLKHVASCNAMHLQQSVVRFSMLSGQGDSLAVKPPEFIRQHSYG